MKIKIVFILTDSNRYSLSPLISIAEEFDIEIDFLYLKNEIKKLIKREDIDKYIQSKVFQSTNFFSNLDENHLIIYILSFTSWYRRFFIRLSRLIKQTINNSLVIAGGTDITGDYNLLYKFFDLIVVGEGELLFFYILDYLHSKIIKTGNKISKKIVDNIRGIFINNGKILYFKNLDKSIFYNIDYKKIIKKLTNLYFSKYKKFNILDNSDKIRSKFLSKLEKSINPLKEIFTISPIFPFKTKFFHPVELTRGCSGLCYFCETPFIFGISEYHKSPEIIINSLEYSFKFNKKVVRFITPNFLSYYYNYQEFSENSLNLFSYNNISYIKNIKVIDKKIKPNYKAIEFLLKNIKKLDREIEIYTGTFPSELSPLYIDDKIISILKNYSTNKSVIMGLQTANNNLLKKIGRNYTIEFFNKKVEIVLKYYEEVIIDIIFGLPFEKEEDQIENLNYMEKMSEKNIKFNIHYFLPLPGTPFARYSPTPISKKIIKKIESISGKTKSFGNWKKHYQEFLQRININDI